MIRRRSRALRSVGRRRARVLRDTTAGSFIEYVALLGIVALVAIGSWRRFGGSIRAVVEHQAHQVRTLEGADLEGSEGTGSTSGNPAGGNPAGGANPQGGAGTGNGSGTAGPSGPIDPGGGAGGSSGSGGRTTTTGNPQDDPTRSGGAGGAKPAASPADKLTADILKVMCPKDKAFLQDLKKRGVTITAYDRIYFEDPYFDGTKWTTKHFEAGGTTSGTDINMIRSSSSAENAAVIFHEGVHTGQPKSMAWRDKEYDAYVQEDQWRISHGLPPHDPTFRKVDASGKSVTDDAAIRAFVNAHYPGVTSTPTSGAPPEQVIGKSASGDTIVRRGDGTTYTRPPKAGDSYSGPEVTEPPGGIPIDINKLQCP